MGRPGKWEVGVMEFGLNTSASDVSATNVSRMLTGDKNCRRPLSEFYQTENNYRPIFCGHVYTAQVRLDIFGSSFRAEFLATIHIF